MSGLGSLLAVVAGITLNRPIRPLDCIIVRSNNPFLLKSPQII